MTRIYHNPRCSKSRATLALLQEHDIEPEVVLYLESPPDSSTLKQLTEALDCSIHDIMRSGEPVYKELKIGDSEKDEDSLIRFVIENPILLERPIVTHAGKAAIGRPPEKVLTLFK
ncbi:MAG: arsenate reductase (glutaredoxin) [Gammaproteobacteria bacterium]